MIISKVKTVMTNFSVAQITILCMGIPAMTISTARRAMTPLSEMVAMMFSSAVRTMITLREMTAMKVQAMTISTAKQGMILSWVTRAMICCSAATVMIILMAILALITLMEEPEMMKSLVETMLIYYLAGKVMIL